MERLLCETFLRTEALSGLPYLLATFAKYHPSYIDCHIQVKVCFFSVTRRSCYYCNAFKHCSTAQPQVVFLWNYWRTAPPSQWRPSQVPPGFHFTSFANSSLSRSGREAGDCRVVGCPALDRIARTINDWDLPLLNSIV